MANKKAALASVFSALLPLLSSPAVMAGGGEGVDFDKGIQVSPVVKEAWERAKAVVALAGVAAPKPGAKDDSLWVSFSISDIMQSGGAGFPLGLPLKQSDRAALFKVPSALLPVLAEFMHERFKKCGGFFTHQSQEEAERDLAAPMKVSAGSYTLDQQAVVAPLIAKVKEAEIRGTIDKMASFRNRYYTSDTGVQAAQWLAGRWKSLAAGMPGASVQLFKHDSWAQPSVILTVPGTENPDEIVVLGGHLDSINGWGSESARAPGADDNASGIAVVTEAIRVLGEAGFRPKRTLEFMGYAAEEVGLRGSADIAQKYASAGKKVVAVVQYDMTNFKGNDEEIWMLTDNVDDTLTAFIEKLIDTYVKVKWSTTQCGYGCSDHASWTQNGYPSALPFEASFDGMNHALHTERDTLATTGGTADHSVNFAKLALSFAVEIAKAAKGAAAASR